MSLRGYVKQLRPIQENKINYVSKVQHIVEELDLPKEVFDGLEHEVNTKKSSSRRTVITVKSANRDDDRDEILRRLKQSGITASIGSSTSSVDPVDGVHDGNNFRIEVKPLSGGMQETTLNSSITELFPCIAFENNYRPKSVESFMEFLMSIDVKKLKCVHSSDIEAANETINKAESSSKYQVKMNNAIAITQYLYDTSKSKPIDSVYWGYRSSSKPKGVPGNHPGDVFIKFGGRSNIQFLGVSLKAGGKKTKEPQLNTYVRPVWRFFNKENDLQKLRQTAYSQVYSKIKGIPSIENFDGGRTGRHKDKKMTEKALVDYNRVNNRGYEKDYDTMLEIMRVGIINLFNKNVEKSKEYIKSEVLRDAPEVPTVVIKASDTDYEEITDRDELGVFLPQVTFVRALKNTKSKSKQDWLIELNSREEKIEMKMSIRSNKSGNAGQKKLGQYPTGLSVKYNGIV